MPINRGYGAHGRMARPLIDVANLLEAVIVVRFRKDVV